MTQWKKKEEYKTRLLSKSLVVRCSVVWQFESRSSTVSWICDCILALVYRNRYLSGTFANYSSWAPAWERERNSKPRQIGFRQTLLTKETWRFVNCVNYNSIESSECGRGDCRKRWLLQGFVYGNILDRPKTGRVWAKTGKKTGMFDRTTWPAPVRPLFQALSKGEPLGRKG